MRAARPPEAVTSASGHDAHIARSTWLFGGFGAVGAELFSISAVWYVVSQQGAAGALILIPQLVCAVVSGLLGRQVTRRVQPGTIMWVSEALRIVSAAVAAMTTLLGGSVAYVVIAACLSLATRPHLDAALISSVSTRTSSSVDAHRVASVLDGLFRSARLFSPALVAVIALTVGDRYVPLFALLAFILALAASIPVVRAVSANHISAEDTPREKDSAHADTGDAQETTASLRGWFTVNHLGQAVNAGAWHVGFTFGTALLFSSGASTGLAGFGGLVVAYGLGNLIGSALMTWLRSPRPFVVCWSSRGVSAVGYLILGVGGPEAYWLLAVGAVLAALGTPLSDLSFLHVVQRLPSREQVHPLRVKMTSEFSGMLVALCLAPLILAHLGRSGLLACCVAALALFVVVGAADYFRRRRNAYI